MPDIDVDLRPRSLTDFDGQPELVNELGIVLRSAVARDTLPDHLLFAGPPGTGKTTLANIVASELGHPIVVTSGPAITKAGDLAAILTRIDEPTIVFIDEIHGLAAPVEEFLYPALEDGVIDVAVVDDVVRIPVGPFCLVGATTQAGQLSGPLRDRFGYLGKLEPYGHEALTRIVERSAGLLGLDIDAGAAGVVAGAARATPRVANRLLGLVRDWAVDTGTAAVDETAAVDALAAFGYDGAGLDRIARRLIHELCVTFGGGPIGLDNLAKVLDVHPSTIEDEYEPMLLRAAMIVRTPRGRVAGPEAWTYLGVDAPAEAPTVTTRARRTIPRATKPGPGQTNLGMTS